MVMSNQEKKRSKWTSRDHWLFLNAVANGPQRMIDTIGEWQELANGIPGKTPDEVKAYYKAVEHDLLEIEAGRVKLPNYPDDDDDIGGESSVVEAGTGQCKSGEKEERKKATPWSVEEHKRFLQGLEIYGKGDWRSISRMMVVTRTATQVASHAQKYFLRQASLKEDYNKEENRKRKKRKRSSIHDITTADASMVVPVQPSSASPPATSLNDGDQGTGVPAGPTTLSTHGGQSIGSHDIAATIQPTSPTTSLYGDQATTLSPFGSGRGAQSSITQWPSSTTTAVSHTQPISSSPPAASFYDSRGKDLYRGQGQPVTSFYGGQTTTSSPSGGGRGAQSSITQWMTSTTTAVVHAQPISSTAPNTSLYESRSKDLYCGEEQLVTSFYGEAVPLRYEIMAAKDYSEEVFGFENISYVSEPNFE
ncbi:putative transcription factor MYB-related family [Helianthus annuus]|nr:putative transcription factor MYB-related family [Helianthus annuus]